MSVLGCVLDKNDWYAFVDTKLHSVSKGADLFEDVHFLSRPYDLALDEHSISQIKRLIGRSFSDPELLQEIRWLPFRVTERRDGFPEIRVLYRGQCQTLTLTQVLGLFFSHMKKRAEERFNTAFVDCCIGIPIYFTNLQRRAVMNAAAIAGLNPLRLMHETTAFALAYCQRITSPHNVAFVDIGTASMQVCIAHVRRGKVMVLAHSFDRCLGGRDFDEVLFQHFAGKFEVDYKINVLQNKEARFRLRAECEKLKKRLTEFRVARLDIKGLMNVNYVSGVISRDEFEQLSAPILERVKKTLENALAEAQLIVDDIEAVQVVGLGGMVPAVKKILTNFFGIVPRPAMDTMDSVAVGCALDCVMLSKPTSEIREVDVTDRFPFSIALKWKGNDHQSVVFPKGTPIPSVEDLTFARSGTFSLEYTDVSELKAPTVSTYTIGPFQATHAEGVIFKVRAHLDLHGIVYLDIAGLIEEEVKVPVTKERWREATKMDTDIALETNDTKVESSKKVVKKSSKKKVKKSNLPVIEVQQAVQDCVIDEAKKNALVAYVNDMWFKLYDKLFGFAAASERVQLIAKLHETEDWLYKDGEDETIGVYEAKLDELKKQGDPIEQRYRQHFIKEIVDIRRDMLAYVDDMRDKLHVRGQLYEFVTDSVRYKLIAKLKQTKAWLHKDELIAKLEKTKDWLHKHELNQLMETKGGYVAKFDELKKLGDPIEHRFKENSEIRYAVGELAKHIQLCKNKVAESKYERKNCRAQVLRQCNFTECWARSVKDSQMERPKHVSPPILPSHVNKMKENLIRVCDKILSTVDNGAGDNAVKTKIVAKTKSSSQRPRILREEIRYLINESLRQNFHELPDVYGQFINVEGDALEKHGDDYQCSNVIDICKRLREKDPGLFWEKGTKEIAEVIMTDLWKSDMIQKVCLRGGCLISFKLSWEWMVKRIENMIHDGIRTWAPRYRIKTALIDVPTPAEHSDLYADDIRSQFVRDALARLFEYSGIDVRCRASNMSFDDRFQHEFDKKFCVYYGELVRRPDPTPLFVWRRETRTKRWEHDNVSIDLGSLWSGINVYHANIMVYVTPARQRGYIEKCINAAIDVEWLDSVTKAYCCGYLTSRSEKEKLSCLADEFRNDSKAASLVELGKAAGYTCTAELVFECALRYTYLANHRLVECTFSVEEMFDVQGNTFVYLLNTLALAHSCMKNFRRETVKEELVSKEHELGLHLMRLTDAVQDSCTLVLPHLMCEYLFDLCKKFTRCYSEVPPVETRLFLCKATVIVMEKCFQLLQITPESFKDHQQPLERFLSSQDEAALNYYVPWPFSEDNTVTRRGRNSRLEMFTMCVSLYDQGFDVGDLFGSIIVSDHFGLTPEGWSKYSGDVGFVAYFERHWSNPICIKSDSFLSFANPKSRHAVAFGSAIDINVDLVVTSPGKGKRKDACYRLCHSKSKEDKKLKKFWEEEKEVECEYMSFRSNDGVMGIYFIMIRNAIDVKMEFRYVSHNSSVDGIRVRGHVHAFYAGVLDDLDGFEKTCYQAVVFKTHGASVVDDETLELEKSILAVPANGCLMISAFLEDVNSGKMIMDGTKSFQAIPQGTNKWEMPVHGGKKGCFILSLEWNIGH